MQVGAVVCPPLTGIHPRLGVRTSAQAEIGQGRGCNALVADRAPEGLVLGPRKPLGYPLTQSKKNWDWHRFGTGRIFPQPPTGRL